MTVVVGLLIGNETWQLLERCLRSLRKLHPDQSVLIYYSLDSADGIILNKLEDLSIESIDIGKPGLMRLLSSSSYSSYNTPEFNIKTSFKWLALLAAMSSRLDHVLFIDADIKILSPLPFDAFSEIWEHYDIFVQDEGNSIFPKHPCTGFLGLKFCGSNISLLQALHKEHCAAIVSSESQHDQNVFYSYISRDIDLYKKIYFLPQRLFPVGYLGPIFKKFNPGSLSFGSQESPFIYHANWVVGIDAKAGLMDGFEGLESADWQKDDACFSYRVGDHFIELPDGHLLPIYQQKHPCYDRFLPFLVREFHEGSVVVDVGANCGDSLAAMVSSNPCLHYVCIEAHLPFFSLLQSNIHSIKGTRPQLQVDALHALIGQDGRYATLSGSGGTKYAEVACNGDGSIPSKSLDEALSFLQRDLSITLLKSDTDGWDYDVILSAKQIIKRNSPLVFFECQFADAQQLEGFNIAIDWLIENGYQSWFIFDNFGNFLLQTDNAELLKSLMLYLNRQNLGVASRTFYYMDILAVQPMQERLAAAAVTAFLNEVAKQTQ